MRTREQLNADAEVVRGKINNSGWLLWIITCGFIAVVAGLALGNSYVVVCGLAVLKFPGFILSGYTATQKYLNRE